RPVRRAGVEPAGADRRDLSAPGLLRHAEGPRGGPGVRVAAFRFPGAAAKVEPGGGGGPTQAAGCRETERALALSTCRVSGTTRHDRPRPAPEGRGVAARPGAQVISTNWPAHPTHGGARSVSRLSGQVLLMATASTVRSVLALIALIATG